MEILDLSGFLGPCVGSHNWAPALDIEITKRRPGELCSLRRLHGLGAHRNDAEYDPIQYQRNGVTTIDLYQ